MDPIADYITQINNAMRANPKRPSVEVKSSYVKKRLTEILHEQGYIKAYTFNDKKNHQGTINITLKYHPKTKQPAIAKFVRVSKLSKRVYTKAKDLPQVLNGLGLSILSTSQGVMTNKQARKKGIGGEDLCHIY